MLTGKIALSCLALVLVASACGSDAGSSEQTSGGAASRTGGASGTAAGGDANAGTSSGGSSARGGTGGTNDAGSPGAAGDGEQAGAPAGTGGEPTGTGGSEQAGAPSAGGAAGTPGAGGTGEQAGAGPEPGGAGGEPPVLADCPDVGLDAAVVHHVCDCQDGALPECVAGSDTGAGTADDPFQTYARARQAFAGLSPGETIAFCRGGAFEITGERDWVNEACTAAEPCVVRDYAPDWAASDAPRPILTADTDYAFSLANGGDATHEEGYTFLNLDLRSRSGGTDANGFFFYNDIDDVLVCGTAIDGFLIGFHIEGSNAPAAGSDAKNARIVLRNSSVTNNGGQGWLGSCDDCGLAYTYFENNGFGAASSGDAVRNHNVYFSSHQLVTGMYAVGNELYRSALWDGSCAGVPLVVHGLFQDLSIEGNLIREDVDAAGGGCWGLAVDTGYGGEAEAFTDVVIRGNTVINTGNVSIGTSGCANCLIENNLVVQEQTSFGGGVLIAAPNRDRGSEDQATTAVTVRNNTLIDRSSAGFTAVRLGVEGSEHVVTNNAIFDDGGGTLTCFDYDLPDASYATRDDNLCFTASGTLSWEPDDPTLESFQAATGADLESVSSDPLFVSTTPPYDFHPGDGSPLLDAGNSPAPADDIEGAARDSSPDIGAYER